MTELRRLWSLFAPERGWIWLGAGAALVTVLASIALMAVSGWFITAMAAAGAAGVAMNYFTPAALIRLSAILRTAGRYGERLATHEATLGGLARLRVWLYERLLPLAPAALQDLHSGDVQARIRADVDALDALVIRVLVPSAVASAAALLLVIALALLDWRFALLELTFLALAGLAAPALAERLGRGPGTRVATLESRLREASVDGLQGLAELQVLGAAEDHARRIDRLGRDLAAEQVRLAGYAGLGAAAAGLAAQLALWSMLLLAVPQVADGRLAAPQLAMLALLVLASFESVAPLPLAYQQLGRIRAAARRLFELADAPPPVREPVRPAPLPEGHDLVIRGLGFSYPGTRAAVLADIDLSIPQGGRLAIVGPSGSGKSTLLDLILRFREPDAGSISLGGRDISTLRGDDLRRRVTLVSQRTHLFASSIRDNLLLANPEASPARLEQVCRASQIHDWIITLPEGYDTWVGETGVQLSGGQARRIAIARALLRDAPVLLLDEPTEGLDAATERDLFDALDRLMTGRTVILISHRALGPAWSGRTLSLVGGRIR